MIEQIYYNICVYLKVYLWLSLKVYLDMIFPVSEVPPVHPVEVMVGGVAELGRVPGHPVHQRRELEEGVDL